jgi:sugar fermentation stimulation protein A
LKPCQGSTNRIKNTLHFNLPLHKGTLLRRYKRFLSDIRLDSGQEITAHCPNPGSMLGCNTPGSPVIVSEAHNPNRKLKYTWELIDVGATRIGVNPLRANRIVEEAIRNGHIKSLHGFSQLRREVPYGKNSRVDFVLEYEHAKIFIEVKSVTYAEQGIAMFPDAPTARGRKHLQELIDVVANGDEALIVFLVQRQDTHFFRPAHHIDAEYASSLRKAHQSGVQILACDCNVSEEGIRLRGELEWGLSGDAFLFISRSKGVVLHSR